MLSVNLVQHKETSQMEISPTHKASASLIPDMDLQGSVQGQGRSDLPESLTFTGARTATRLPMRQEQRTEQDLSLKLQSCPAP